MSTATVSASVKYTGVGGASQTVSFSGTPTYTAENIGILDIPDTTADATAFDIPFGEVAAAKVLVLRNTNNVDLKIGVNGTEDTFRLAPSGVIVIENPVAPGGSPITSCQVTTVGIQSGPGSFEYMVFGA